MKRIISAIFACLLGVTMTGAAWAACTANEIDVLGDGTQCEATKFTLTTASNRTTGSFSMTAIGTFYVSCGDGGTLSVSSGGTPVVIPDGVIIRTNDTNTQYTCTWPSAGAHTVRFSGTATAYGTNPTSAAIGLSSMYPTSVSGSLGAIFPTLGNATNQIPSFYRLFAFGNNTGCLLETIPATLFSGVTGSRASMFNSAFHGCAPLEEIPAGLFSGISGSAESLFDYIFAGCTTLTSVPTGLFNGVSGSADNMFRGVFDGCTNLATVPETLFSGVTGGAQCLFCNAFRNCTSLTSIPAGLFSGVSTAAVDMFNQVFQGCTSLGSYIPPTTFAGLIANNSPKASRMWNNAFQNTNVATQCPAGMAQYITKYEGSGTNTWDTRVSCEPCAAGTYRDTAGLGACTACANGTYSSTTGATQCTACPTGYDYNTTAGKTSITQCQIHCDAGTYVRTALVPLPTEYTRLLYLESNGTQYINTGYSWASSETARVVIDAAYTNFDETTANIYHGANPGLFVGATRNGSDKKGLSWGTRTSHILVDAVQDIRYLFDVDIPNRIYTIRDVNYDITLAASNDDVSDANVAVNNFYLFASGTRANSRISSKIYSVKLYDNGVLVRDMVPVRRNSDDVLGMYDIVNDTFYTNAGTGTFVAGDLVAGSDGMCENVHPGHWAAASTTNFGSSGTRNECGIGTYSSIENGVSAAACLPCDGATYGDIPALAACKPCPTGYTHDTTNGKTSPNQCKILCDAGTYIPNTTSAEYTRLDYLEGTGTQYIRTNFSHSSPNIRGVVRVGVSKNMPESFNQDIMGNIGGNTKGYSVGWAKSFKIWVVSSASRLNLSEQTLAAETMHEFTYELTEDSRSLTYGDETVSGTHDGKIVGTGTSNIGLFFNGQATDGGDPKTFQGRIYRITLYEDDVLVHDFVPVQRNRDGVLGMYDEVTDRFFTNSGTGDFIGVMQGSCTNVGTGYYSSATAVNYGNTTPRTACPVGTYSDITNGASCKPCTGATYGDEEALAACKSCPAGYDYNTESNKTNINQCQVHCDGGTYVAEIPVLPSSENDNDDTVCSDVGSGYWAGPSTVNYGAIGTRNACPVPFTMSVQPADDPKYCYGICNLEPHAIEMSGQDYNNAGDIQDTCEIVKCELGYKLVSKVINGWNVGECVECTAGNYCDGINETSCSTATDGAYTLSDPGAGDTTDCYKNCTVPCYIPEQCEIENTSSCSYDTDEGFVSGKEYNNGSGLCDIGNQQQQKCELNTYVCAKDYYDSADADNPCDLCSNVTFEKRGNDLSDSDLCPDGTTQIAGALYGTSQSYTQTCYREESSGDVGAESEYDCVGEQNCGEKHYGQCRPYSCTSGYYHDFDLDTCVKCDANYPYSNGPEDIPEDIPDGYDLEFQPNTSLFACYKNCDLVENAAEMAGKYYNGLGNTCRIKSCIPGYYLEDNTCKQCTANHYCNGIGQFDCPEEYPYSDIGADDAAACFRDCTQDDVETNATAFQGRYYSDGNNQCQATKCELGYYLEDGACKQCDVGSYCDGINRFSCADLDDGSWTLSDSGSNESNDCYISCEEHNQGNCLLTPDTDKAYWPNKCKYTVTNNGNPAEVIDGICVVTGCLSNFELINGNCEPCNREHALSYKSEGNCIVDMCEIEYHPKHDQCESDTLECTPLAPHSTYAEQKWVAAHNAYGICTIKTCAAGYHLVSNACVLDEQVCEIAHGTGMKTWDTAAKAWGPCLATSCVPGYTNDPAEKNNASEQCSECRNKFSRLGEVAVSSYTTGCEIASCFYQGEKYNLDNNECVPICDQPYSDATGSMQWNERTKKCERTCNPGYVSW